MEAILASSQAQAKGRWCLRHSVSDSSKAERHAVSHDSVVPLRRDAGARRAPAIAQGSGARGSPSGQSSRAEAPQAGPGRAPQASGEGAKHQPFRPCALAW